MDDSVVGQVTQSVLGTDYEEVPVRLLCSPGCTQRVLGSDLSGRSDWAAVVRGMVLSDCSDHVLVGAATPRETDPDMELSGMVAVRVLGNTGRNVHDHMEREMGPEHHGYALMVLGMAHGLHSRVSVAPATAHESRSHSRASAARAMAHGLRSRVLMVLGKEL